MKIIILKFKSLINSIIESFIRNISGTLGIRMRYMYYKRRFVKCCRNLTIDEGVIIKGAEFMIIGDNVWIDKYCILLAGKVGLEGRICKRSKSK